MNSPLSKEHEAQNARLDRIESKIDKLSDAVIAIARAEERIIAIESDKADYWQRLNNHSAKIDELDVRMHEAENECKTMAKLWEHQTNTTSDTAKRQGERLGNLEHSVADAVRTTAVINKMFWVSFAAFCAFMAQQIFLP